MKQIWSCIVYSLTDSFTHEQIFIIGHNKSNWLELIKKGIYSVNDRIWSFIKPKRKVSSDSEHHPSCLFQISPCQSASSQISTAAVSSVSLSPLLSVPPSGLYWISWRLPFVWPFSLHSVCVHSRSWDPPQAGDLVKFQGRHHLNTDNIKISKSYKMN